MNKTTLFIVIVALFFSAYVYASAKRKLDDDYDLDKLPDPAPDQGIKDFDNLADQF